MFLAELCTICTTSKCCLGFCTWPYHHYGRLPRCGNNMNEIKLSYILFYYRKPKLQQKSWWLLFLAETSQRYLHRSWALADCCASHFPSFYRWFPSPWALQQLHLRDYFYANLSIELAQYLQQCDLFQILVCKQLGKILRLPTCPPFRPHSSQTHRYQLLSHVQPCLVQSSIPQDHD